MILQYYDITILKYYNITLLQYYDYLQYDTNVAHSRFILSTTGNRNDTYQQFNTNTSYNGELSVCVTLSKEGSGHTPKWRWDCY